MEFRRVFDTIPEQFDKFRPKYSEELFAFLNERVGIGPGKRVLEIGPGTGQATDPVLRTGCEYHAIELGEHLYRKMKEKYDKLPNFNIVNDDFINGFELADHLNALFSRIQYLRVRLRLQNAVPILHRDDQIVS